MSIKLTDTQMAVLSAAAQRGDRCLILPRDLKGGAAQKVTAKLIDAGLVKAMRAKPGAPVWRQDTQTGHSFALKLTAASTRAISADSRSSLREALGGKDERSQVAGSDSEANQLTTAEDRTTDAGRSCAPQVGTKLARVLELLQRDCGGTLEELIAATGWLPHTTRAALTGLRKRGYAVTIDRSDKERGSTYRAMLDEAAEAGPAGSETDNPPAISARLKSRNAQRAEERQTQQAA
jgi:hypothetical protein